MSAPQRTSWTWLRNGGEALAAMLAAIREAQVSICLEVYIFVASPIGEQFREELIAARKRGVRVRVLVDALGSYTLPDSFWGPLRLAGGEAKFFNPLALKRMGIRNHRKLMVSDGRIAFVGGFNIAPEYDGDGVTKGWFDLGIKLEGPMVGPLAESFDEMFDLADFRHKRFARLRRFPLKRVEILPTERLLLSGPGRGFNPIRRAVQKDLAKVRHAQLIVAYFLPTGKLWRTFRRVAKHGGRLQLFLAGKSDVLLSQLAAQSLYRRLLRSGVEIQEYQPQILHAKLFVLDNVVYVGSANLDPRSLGINYELMLRFENAQMASHRFGAQSRGDAAVQHLQILEGLRRYGRSHDRGQQEEASEIWHHEGHSIHSGGT